MRCTRFVHSLLLKRGSGEGNWIWKRGSCANRWQRRASTKRTLKWGAVISRGQFGGSIMHYTALRFSHSLSARRRAPLPLQIWIKHRPFVAWIYCCWNVGRVKKKQSSTLTYSQSGKLRHKTGKCERSFDAWCVRMNKNAEGMKLMHLTDLFVCDLINRTHANSH